ncbi:ankyrin repeat domain-containing protein [Legionella quateirensis]|uniref:Ankyrin repeats (3 copies) n=1 Tax=Legionella quateirensis TaxID=45072 RepID=A0A378KYF5_9GAMM|nr:ankyrin repeat domain-containing protein [Legionella quateirensis]KTD48273.1 Ankyrin repeats (3 copies) [Legionella quateirensis]STY18398.1 Ankyrin repeats (3 copies) [Legionella quateirensis]
MPGNLTQAIIKSAQDAQSTHNTVTSNAAAILAIRLASRYLLQKVDIEAPAQPASSPAATSSSVVVPTSTMTIEITGNYKAQERMSHVKKRYEERVKSSQLEPLTKAWLAETLSSRTLSRELDRVTLVEEHNGHRISTEWYLPLPEVYAVVLSALIDKDERRWPVPPRSTAQKERLLRLQEFDRINNALAKATPRVCATGIRHAWLMALDGYDGKRLPLNAEDVLMQGLFDFMVREVLGKQKKIHLPDGRDPVGDERATFHAHFQSLFLPWAYGTMPGTVRDAIKNAGGSDAAREYVLERFRTIGIVPDELMMQKINGYCSKIGLQSIPCNFIPILAALESHAKRQTLATSSGSITATGLRSLADDTLVWLQGADFSPESLVNSANEKDPFSILYLVLRFHDTLYQYKDYKNLLDVCDMPDDNKDAWVNVLHFHSQCLHNPDLSLAPLLEDTATMEERLRTFERGFGVWRTSAYHDFISIYTATWFAASGDDRAFTYASLFTKLCDLFFKENTEGNNCNPVIRVQDAMLAEWIARTEEDGVLEVTPYQINRILLHALCYPADNWSLLFQQCLPILLKFIRNRCNQTENSAGDALARDSWPEALLAQIERLNAPAPEGETPFPVMITPGYITPEFSPEIAGLIALSTDLPEAIVRQIVAHPGFDPNATDNKSLTPFYIAASFGHTELAAALIDKGANYRVKYKGRFPPLQEAIENQHLSFIQWFLQTLPEHQRVDVVIDKNYCGISMLHLAVDYPNTLKLLLNYLPKEERASALITKNYIGYTVMHLARNDSKILKLLMKTLPEKDRAEVLMTKNNKGDTVLHTLEDSPKTIRLLLDYLPKTARAEVLMATDADGNTALHRIAKNAPKYLKQLLDCLPKAARAAALMVTNEDGNTVLHEVETTRPAILKPLVNRLSEETRAGALMICNKYGNSVLHLTAAKHPKILKKLLDCLPKAARAEAVMVKSLYGNTLLHVAAARQIQSLNWLLDYLPETARADAIMVKNCDGITILDLVKRARCSKSLHLLKSLQEQAKKQTTTPTTVDSTIPNHDSGSALLLTASSSETDTSTLLSSHSMFSQGSVAPPDPVSPGKLRALKR